MGSIDKALPHAGFYPDSQNLRSDGAKIRSIIESPKYFGTFFIARVKISRLIKDNFVEMIGEYPDNGSSKAVYQKTGLIMR